jgi:hypothetical protein
MSVAERYSVFTSGRKEAVECPGCDGVGDFVVDEGTCPLCAGEGELTAGRLMTLAEGLRFWQVAQNGRPANGVTHTRPAKGWGGND